MMLNDYQVTVRRIASNQFAEHIEFLARKSVNAANRIIDEFVKIKELLAKTPEMFPVFYKSFRKINIEPRYAVLYEIVDKDVFIDKILDMRQLEYNSIINDIKSELPS